MARLIAASTSRRNANDDDEDGDEVDGDVASNQSSLKKRSVSQSIGGTQSGIDKFGEHMKEAFLALVEFENRRLDFELDRYARDREERVKDRVKERDELCKDREEERSERLRERDEDQRDRLEERQQQNQLELEKFRLFMSALKNY